MRKQFINHSFVFGGILLAAVVFLGGMAVNGQTHSDFDKTYKFTQSGTWDFANEKVNTRDKFGKNEIWDGYLRESLTAGLAKIGFNHSDNRPDLIIKYRFGTKEKKRTTVLHDNWPGYMYNRRGWVYWRGGGGWGSRTVFRTPYDQSTLIVDVVDARTKELVWRGYDRRTVDSKSERTIKKSVEKLMDKFAKDVRESRKI